MKNTVIALIVAALIVAGGAWYLSSKRSSAPAPKDDAMMKQDESMMKDDEAMMKKEGDTMMKKDDSAAMMKSAGSYEAYSADKVARAASGDVILFFRADWCPTCKAADANIKANLKAIPENTTILDVNYDNSADLKKKYGVTYQHTFVQVDAQGNMIKKWSGSSTLAELLAQVQ